jgi:hypothetical protein
LTAATITTAKGQEDRTFDEMRLEIVARYGFGLSDELWDRLSPRSKAEYLTAILDVIRVLEIN